MKSILLYASLAWMACFSWLALPALSTAATAQAPCGAAVSQYDPNPDNNCDSATTEVLPPPDQGGGSNGPGGGPSPSFPASTPDVNTSTPTTSVSAGIPDVITTSVPAGDTNTTAVYEAAPTVTAPSGEVPMEEAVPYIAAASSTPAPAPIPAPAPAPVVPAPVAPAPAVEPSADPITTTEQPATVTAGAAPSAVASSAVATSAPSAHPAQRTALPDTGGPAAFLISTGAFALAAGFLMRKLLPTR